MAKMAKKPRPNSRDDESIQDQNSDISSQSETGGDVASVAQCRKGMKLSFFLLLILILFTSGFFSLRFRWLVNIIERYSFNTSSICGGFVELSDLQIVQFFTDSKIL